MPNEKNPEISTKSLKQKHLFIVTIKKINSSRNPKVLTLNLVPKKDRKHRKISNNIDCPIHGNSHKWGQCHQNQYRENFRPRHNNNISSTHSSFSQNRSQRSSFYQQGTTSQVQVYNYKRRPNNTDNRSKQNGYSGKSNRNLPSYQNKNNQSYRDQISIEIYNYKDKDVDNYFPEGYILVQLHNNTSKDLAVLQVWLVENNIKWLK